MYTIIYFHILCVYEGGVEENYLFGSKSMKNRNEFFNILYIVLISVEGHLKKERGSKKNVIF